MTAFNVKEGDVAKRLGVGRDEVRELRAANLYQDEDFGKVGREILYTEDGIEKIRKFIKKTTPAGITLGDLAPMKAVARGSNSDAPTVILDAVVTKIYPKNPKYMEALLGGQQVTICVNSNANFIEGMIIPAKQLAVRNQRVFDFIGRCPRARGKW